MSALDPILAILLTAVAAVLLTLLLRAAGLPRAAVVGGLLAGVLVGATVFGRVAPEAYQRYFTGGVAQSDALRQLRSRQGADLTALRATDVSDAAADELITRQKAELLAATKALDAAVQAHQTSRLVLIAMAALSLIIAAAPRSRRPASLSECAFAGLWMLVLTSGIVGLAVVFVFQGTRTQALALGLTFAAMGTNVILPPRSEEATGRLMVVIPTEIRERLVDIAFVVWFIGFVAATAAVIAASRLSTAAAHDFSVTLPVAVIAGVGMRMLPLQVRHALRMVVLPSVLTALLVVSLDLMTWTVVPPLVLAVVVGGDARWFGLASGMRWQGWAWRNAWLGTLPLVDAAPMQVAMAGVFFVCGWLNEPLLACAVFGAAICDVTQPLRPRLLAMLNEQTEDQSQS